MEKKVRVYTTTFCPWCIAAKNFLKKYNIPFQEINVEKDKKAAEEMIRKSGQTGVPVIEIDGKIIIGFDERKIKEALGLK